LNAYYCMLFRSRVRVSGYEDVFMLPSIVIVTFAEESDAILLAIDPVSRVYP